MLRLLLLQHWIDFIKILKTIGKKFIIFIKFVQCFNRFSQRDQIWAKKLISFDSIEIESKKRVRIVSVSIESV